MEKQKINVTSFHNDENYLKDNIKYEKLLSKFGDNPNKFFIGVINIFKDRPKNDKDMYFFKHPKKGGTCFYSVHGQDYNTLYNDGITDIELGFVDYECKHPGLIRKKIIISSVFNEKAFNELVKRLIIQKRVKCLIYNRDRNCSISSKPEIISPGNFSDEIEEQLLEDNDFIPFSATSIACIQFELAKNGLPEWHLGTYCKNNKTITICSFIDNNQLSNLENLFVQLNVNECIYKFSKKIVKNVVGSKFNEVVNKCNASQTEKGRSFFKTYSNFHDFKNRVLKHLLNVVEMKKLNEIEFSKSNVKSFECVGSLIEHLNLLSDNNNSKKYHKFVKYKNEKYMKIDSTVLRSLQIFPKINDEFKDVSLYGLLNKCNTRIGSRRLNTLIRQPLVDKDSINERLTLVEVFKNSEELRTEIMQTLKIDMPDLDISIKKVHSGNASVYHLYMFFQAVQSLILISTKIQEYGDLSNPVLKKFYMEIIGILRELDLYSQFVEEFVDIELIKENPADKSNYRVSCHFTAKLTSLKKSIDSIKDKINKRISAIEDKFGLTVKKDKKSNLKWVKQDKLEHCLKFQKGRKRENVQKFKDIKEECILLKQNPKGTIIFVTTKRLRKRFEKLVEKEEIYEEKSEELLRHANSTISSYCNVFEKMMDIIFRIDIYSTFATIAIERDYVRPTILNSNENIIEIKDGRHPMVEKIIENPDIIQNAPSQFIPNSLTMSGSKGRFQVITGANSGGKSTFLHQNALIVLMAQIGCFVPAKSATISIRDGIFARIGSNDYMIKGISTFYAEMIEASSLLRNITNNSLIVIDELGRGTNSEEGFGLAYGICKYIIEKNSFCLFATHFHDLAILLKRKYNDIVMNYSADVDTTIKVILKYQMVEGAANDSFGIEVAKIAGFPKRVIDRAEAVSRSGKKRRRNIEEEEEEEEEINKLHPNKKMKVSDDNDDDENITEEDLLLIDNINQFSKDYIQNLARPKIPLDINKEERNDFEKELAKYRNRLKNKYELFIQKNRGGGSLGSKTIDYIDKALENYKKHDTVHPD